MITSRLQKAHFHFDITHDHAAAHKPEFVMNEQNTVIEMCSIGPDRDRLEVS